MVLHIFLFLINASGQLILNWDISTWALLFWIITIIIQFFFLGRGFNSWKGTMKILNPFKCFIQNVVYLLDTIFIKQMKSFDLGLAHLHQFQFHKHPLAWHQVEEEGQKQLQRKTTSFPLVHLAKKKKKACSKRLHLTHWLHMFWSETFISLSSSFFS